MEGNCTECQITFCYSPLQLAPRCQTETTVQSQKKVPTLGCKLVSASSGEVQVYRMLFTSEGRVEQDTYRQTGVVLAVSRHYTGGL